jgi:hypothetical protein
VAGVVYTDTYLQAGTDMSASRGSRSTTAGAWFSQFSYRYDDVTAKPTPVGESFTTGVGPDLSVAVGKSLGTATVSGTVMVVSCTIDADYNETCGDPVATAVRGTWTATGSRLHVVSTFHARDPASRSAARSRVRTARRSPRRPSAASRSRAPWGSVTSTTARAIPCRSATLRPAEGSTPRRSPCASAEPPGCPGRTKAHHPGRGAHGACPGPPAQ